MGLGFEWSNWTPESATASVEKAEIMEPGSTFGSRKEKYNVSNSANMLPNGDIYTSHFWTQKHFQVA